jgi:hypothetical protein
VQLTAIKGGASGRRKMGQRFIYPPTSIDAVLSTDASSAESSTPFQTQAPK